MFPKTPKGPLYQQWVSAQPTLPEQLQIEAGSLEVLGVQSQPHSGAESAWIVLICEEKRTWGKIDSSYFFPYYLPNGPHPRDMYLSGKKSEWHGKTSTWSESSEWHSK